MRQHVMITGHRPPGIGNTGYKPNNIQSWVRFQITSQLRRFAAQQRTTGIRGISGMAIGVDQWFAEACIDLDIPFIAYIPFPGQEERWPTHSQDHYHYLLDQAESQHLVTNGKYSAASMQARNVAMVDNADYHIAVWNGTTSGTKNCIDYIRKKRLRFLHINPASQTIRWNY